MDQEPVFASQQTLTGHSRRVVPRRASDAHRKKGVANKITADIREGAIAGFARHGSNGRGEGGFAGIPAFISRRNIRKQLRALSRSCFRCSINGTGMGGATVTSINIVSVPEGRFSRPKRSPRCATPRMGHALLSTSRRRRPLRRQSRQNLRQNPLRSLPRSQIVLPRARALVEPLPASPARFSTSDAAVAHTSAAYRRRDHSSHQHDGEHGPNSGRSSAHVRERALRDEVDGKAIIMRDPGIRPRPPRRPSWASRCAWRSHFPHYNSFDRVSCVSKSLIYLVLFAFRFPHCGLEVECWIGRRIHLGAAIVVPGMDQRQRSPGQRGSGERNPLGVELQSRGLFAEQVARPLRRRAIEPDLHDAPRRKGFSARPLRVRTRAWGGGAGVGERIPSRRSRSGNRVYEFSYFLRLYHITYTRNTVQTAPVKSARP